VNGDGNSWQWIWGNVARLSFGRLHYAARNAVDTGVVRNRLVYAGLSLILVTIFGTAGYYIIGDGQWLLEDCAYMVLITITSVGYGEVLPVSDTEQGRIFTMMLLICGMGVSFYFLSALTAFIIEGDLREALWRRRMLKRLGNLDKHVIVCGAGRTGTHVASELLRAGCDVVIIEHNKDNLEGLHKAHGDAFLAIEGDATDDRVLKDAGVETARGLVAALRQDQDNLFVSLSARQLNEQLRIVSRANADRVAAKLKQAGADAIVSPTNIGGRRMAQEMLRPHVVGFLDFIGRDVQRNLDIEEIFIGDGSPVAGCSLATSEIRQKSSALVLAVIGENADPTYNPPPDFTLEVGMTLIVLGEREQLERLNAFMDGGA